MTSLKGMCIGQNAKALSITLDEFAYGSSSNVESDPDLRGKVPLISWVQAGYWLGMDVSQAEAPKYYAHTTSVGPRAFALRIRGSRMTRYTGGKSIPEGSIVIVDPDIPAENGKVGIAPWTKPPRQH
ncbi:LexA family protein [Aliidiomarina shirensis]|uniref:LexA family protein n=1 Tax=Aliidiomarina shirensis TaxID=1048642 RepID=UPI000F87B6E2|nr:S24 family peptidase [Aliidiomarina shirensis]